MSHAHAPLRVFIDGGCPFCRIEAELLRQLDRGRGRLILDDIAAPEFDPSRYGLTLDELMREIHALTWDGRILRGMDVFRAAYAAVGLGWLAAPTGWLGLRMAFDIAYNVFSHNRLRLGGLLSPCGCGRHDPRTEASCLRTTADRRIPVRILAPSLNLSARRPSIR